MTKLNIPESSSYKSPLRAILTSYQYCVITVKKSSFCTFTICKYRIIIFLVTFVLHCCPFSSLSCHIILHLLRLRDRRECLGRRRCRIMWHDSEENGQQCKTNAARTLFFYIRISLIYSFTTVETGHNDYQIAALALFYNSHCENKLK